MKKYVSPSIKSFMKGDAGNYIKMDPCDCGHTGSQSIPHCGNGNNARA